MPDGFETLTCKEKETLRLMGRGHDAKSMANELSLSVHTINERLRAARRKLGVTSSREAARLILEREGTGNADGPENLVPKELGEAAIEQSREDAGMVKGKPAPRHVIAGVFAMLAIVAAALFLSPQITGSDPVAGSSQASANDAVVERAARDWLEIGDTGDYRAAFDAAGSGLRKPNTPDGFSKVSQEVRTPLGAVIAREVQSVRFLNAPPHGYQEVVFSTSFANRADVLETVTLEKEDGQWKVVGILID